MVAISIAIFDKLCFIPGNIFSIGGQIQRGTSRGRAKIDESLFCGINKNECHGIC